MSKAVDLRISGFVQGVSFRAYTRAEARRLGVVGWVRNEPDGTVAVHAEGPADAVDSLVAWCRQGPSYAEVADVRVTDTETTGATTFVVRTG